MLGGDFLKTREVLARGIRVALSLIGARDAKLRGGVIEKRGNGLLKFGDGFVVALKLRVKVAEKIMRVRFGGKLRDVLKCRNALFRFADVFIKEAQVVPGVGVVGQEARGFLKSGTRGLEFLLAEQRNAEVQAGDGKLRISSEGFLKIFLGFGEFLLIHVGDAQGVVAKGFGLIAFRLGFRRSLRLLRSAAGSRAQRRNGYGRKNGRADYGQQNSEAVHAQHEVFSLYESSGARHRPPRRETVSIFTADRGTVKLRFRGHNRGRIKFAWKRRNLTCSEDPHTLAGSQMKTLHYASIAEIRESIATKALSPVEVVEAHLERIETLQPKLNAFVHLDAEAALEQARRAGEMLRTERALGPLLGVPVTLKSCIDVARWPCPAGSLLRKDYIAEADATLAARLRAAGAILLGNTNTPEFLMAYETDNLITGKTYNPWDLSRSAGGSSGGEAAAIASGCSAGGVGSDGGGSVRVPAHFCGICGLKPTPGRIPSTGHYPNSVGPFALLGVVGPMARTVADLQMLFEVMAGPDDGDPCSAPVLLRDIFPADLKNIKIGYFEDDDRTPVTPETRTAVRTAAESLKRAGFDVFPFRPDGLELARQLWWKLFGTAGGMLL